MTPEPDETADSLQKLDQDFERSLQRDPTTRVEEFLSNCDTRIDDADRHLLSKEMEFRIREGKDLSEQEYQRRFPHLASEVPDLIAGVQPTRAEEPGKQPSRRIDQSLGDYELLEVIGRGGMGVVYRARQKSLNRIVAVKTIVSGKLASPSELRRFQNEAEAAARLDHPGIVPVFEIGESAGLVFFSMAFVAGRSLAEQLEQNTLAPVAAALVVRKLADAVHFAHQADVVHRDLKPANILMDEHGHPKITDFGLAKLIDQEGMTMTGAVVGTPSYMSPEQAAGESKRIGRTSDVYGLGAILYACLCGQAPFRGPSTMATLKMVALQRAVSLRQLRTDIPHDLDTICQKCLEKDPGARYATAAELADELTRFLEGRPILARPVPVWTRLGQWCKRKPMVAGLVAAIALSLIGGTIASSYFAILAERRAETAEAGFEAARQQSELALKTLQNVVNSVQVKLKSIPQARDVRKELLVQVLDDLEQVATGYVEQATVDEESAKVLTNLAELYTIMGGDLGDNVVELSEAHYRKAVEMYIELLKEKPDDLGLLREGFETTLIFGDTAREYQRFETAIWAHQQGRKIAKHWHAIAPSDPNAQLAYFKSSEALGEAMLRSGHVEECRVHCLNAVELAEAYTSSHPGVMAYDSLARCYCTAGDMYRKLEEYDLAESYYEKMCAMTLKLMELEPDNPNLFGDRSTDFERLGDLEMAQKNYDQAEKYYDQMLSWVQRYIANDPDNLYRLQESTWSYEKLGQVYQAQGNLERAEWATRKLADIKQKLGRDPSEPSNPTEEVGQDE